ncbi:glutathione S-transferase family protein [Achromobacter aloeverae]|uniref:Glutathione S-transferase n=1 Tax=Achromobacter aloeverae TaxID=1750518 RepID=A0A4Q1HN19_9BURK|nr:glutathione S-transferase family protein [Achromobacter aloeverae]RXN92392.1 glutathione S-transferase [Achromobacter aloeverae]
MALQLYYHPFSSYCHKALVAFHENDIAFEGHVIEGPDSAAYRELAARWPIKRFPMLVDGERQVMEATCIVEYLQTSHPGPVRLIPADARAALEVRFLDRFFDNYISTPVQKIVFNALRPDPSVRDPYGVDEAHAMLDDAYGWLEQHMRGRQWACGDAPTLADCGAAPFLFYAHWVHPIQEERHPNIRAYRQRLLQWPSYARCVELARPYRGFFPLPIPADD